MTTRKDEYNEDDWKAYAKAEEVFKKSLIAERDRAISERDALKSECDALKKEHDALNEAIHLVRGWLQREHPELYGEFIDIIFAPLSQNGE